MDLDIVDLDKQQQVVYEAIIDYGPATVEQLADQTSLTDPETTTAVRALELRGLVTRAAGTPDQFTAVPPDMALQALLLNKEEQLKRALMLARKLSTRYHQHSVSTEHPARMVEVVSGRAAVLERLIAIEAATRDRLRTIDKPPYVSAKPEDNLTTELAALARGVCWQAIYDTGGFETGFHDLTGELTTLITAGEQARIITTAPTKLLLSDDRIGMLPLQAAPRGIDSVVIVYPSALLEALSALFDQLWHQALPLRPDTDPTTITGHSTRARPAPDELQLITLMTAGLTDHAIARQLGISKRTLTRRVSDLLGHLGAHTRTQAALQAAAFGWIDPPTNPDT